MKKNYLLIFLSLLTISLIGQNIKIIDQNLNLKIKKSLDSFDLIYEGFELELVDKIATLQGYTTISEKFTIENLFYNFWKESNLLGANSYKIEDLITKDDTNFVIISIYHLSKTEINNNFGFYPKNMVYIIGDIDKRQTSKNIKLNQQKIELLPMEYISYQNKVGQEATVSIGGFLGTKFWIKGEVNKLPKYLSLGGFNVGPGYSNQLSISFNTGKIYPVQLNFGEFLVNVLKENKTL